MNSETVYNLYKNSASVVKTATILFDKVDGRDKSGQMMRCSWPKSIKDQEQGCKYFEKASFAYRCMHLRFDLFCVYFNREEVK